jgi:hypothetical protein
MILLVPKNLYRERATGLVAGGRAAIWRDRRCFNSAFEIGILMVEKEADNNHVLFTSLVSVSLAHGLLL